MAGYRLYWGTVPGLPTRSVDMGLSTQGTVSDVSEGTTYYFTATAVNSKGVESLPSVELPYTVPGADGGSGGGGGGGETEDPTAISLSLLVVEDTDLPILLTGIDPLGRLLSYSIVDMPFNGTLSGVAPFLIYRPNPGFSGEDSFEFLVSAGGNDSGIASINITVLPVNDRPTAVAQSLSLAEDSPLPIRLAGVDDGGNLSYAITRQPANGSLTGTAPNVTYVPAPNFSGTDSFEFVVRDGLLTSPSAVVSLTVTPVNDAPVTVSRLNNGAEDTLIAVTLAGTDPDGDPVTYAVVSQPRNGVLLGTAPNLVYRPSGNFSGPDSFQFTISDGQLTSALGQISINVAPVNDAPVALGQSVSVSSGSSVTVALVGQDVDGDALSYAISRAPARGTISGLAPNLTYTPLANASGNDSFEFTVRDGSLTSAPAQVSITVVAIDSAPVAVAGTAQGTEDSSIAVNLVASDPNGDALSYAVVVPPQRGTLSGTAPNLTYKPAANFFGTDTFQFTASDGTRTSTPALMTIQVAAANDVPTALGQAVTLLEDSPLSVKLSGQDVDGDALTYAISRQPGKGTLSGSPPNVVYTPGTNYFGADSFEFTVRDGTATSVAAVVALTMIPVNDAPVATSRINNGLEDTLIPVTLAGIDPDGDPVTFTITVQPRNGVLVGTAPSLVYRPSTNTTGPDSFQFTISDGTLTSSTATMSINVVPVNDAPMALAQSVSVSGSGPTAIRLAGQDVDDDALTYTISRAPAKGALSGTAPNLTYTPQANASGTDSFEFTVRDGTVVSAPALVSVTVVSLDSTPVAVSGTVQGSEDTSIPVKLVASDADGDAVTYAVVVPPQNGTLSGAAPNLTYRPAAHFSGTDTFQFTASDGTRTSSAAVMTIQVAPVNDAPTALAQSVTLLEDSPLLVRLTGQDVDEDVLTYAITRQPGKGTLSGTPPNVTYTPNTNSFGTDTFEFTVRDGAVTSASALVTLVVTPVNDAPVATSRLANGLEDTLIPVTLAGTDSDADPLTYTVIVQPRNGVLVGTAPSLVYRPSTNTTGPDSFQFTVSDGKQTSAVGLMSVNVAPVNDVPVAFGQTVLVQGESSLAIRLSGQDVDGDALTYSISRAPAKGTLSGVAPNLTYTPFREAEGTDSFEFTVRDGTVSSVPAQVLVTLVATERAPVAVSGTLNGTEDTSIVVKLVASDADGDALTYAVVVPPQKGTLSGAAPNLTYQPAANFSGTDTFQFTASDGTRTSAAAVMTLQVAPVNDAPTAVPQAVTLLEDSPRAIVLAGQDVDGDSMSFVVSQPPLKGTLLGTPPNLTYVPNTNSFGADSFEFTVRDGALTSAPAVVSVTVTPVNDAPLATSRLSNGLEDTTIAVTLAGVDPDGDPLTYRVVVGPQRGVLEGTAPSLVYRPDPNFVGSDLFQFTVSDGTRSSAIALMNINVLPVNDAPVAVSQAISVQGDASVPVTLAGQDADEDVLTFSVTREPTKGTLSGVAPNLAYTPRPDSSGSDSFEFIVRDGVLTSAPAVVSVTVISVKTTPVAVSSTVQATEDTQLVIPLVASDADGDPMTYSVVVGPQNGTLSGTGANLTYQPSTNFFGTDTFRFTASDGSRTSTVATITIQVAGVNDAPVATSRIRNGSEDTLLPVTLAGIDPEGDPVTYTVTVQPRNGVLLGTAPSLVYRPSTNTTGPDSFKFTMTDGSLTSAEGLMSINVAPVNDAPVALGQAVSVQGETATPVTLVGQDVDGDELSYSVARLPAKGTLSGVAPNLTYTPNPGSSGADSFEFTVRDGVLTSAPALVSVTVVSVKTTPVAVSSTVQGTEDTSVAVKLVASDADGEALTYSVVAGPLRGTLTGTAPNLIYQPLTNSFGQDTLRFLATDGSRTSAVATVTINVAAVNDAPTVVAQSVVTPYGTKVSIPINGSDPEGSPLTFEVRDAPSNGTLSGTMTNLVYTPNTGFAGIDSFTVVASDGALESAPATNSVRISLILLASNRGMAVPIAPGSSGDGIAGDSGDGMIGANSTTVVEPSVEWLSLPTHGILDDSQAGVVSYEPALDGATLDSFSFRVNTAEGPSDPTFVALHLVAFQEVKRLEGRVEVSFPTIAGLTYRVEWNDESPSSTIAWQELQTVRPVEPGMVTLAVTNPPNGVFRFIRLTCDGTENSVVSEPWGISSASVAGGMDGRVYSVPFQGPIHLKGRARVVTGNSVEIEAGTLDLPTLVPVGGQVTHALMVRSSGLDARSAGAWWAITGQSTNQIVVDEGVESLAESILPGDEVEIVRLLTVAEVFGKASSPEIQLSDGDRLAISGIGGADYLIEYRISNRGGASYWIVQGDALAGPFDGTTLPLPPFPTFYFVDRVSPGSVVLVGRVQEGPAVQYLHPGARMVGNAFPVSMEVPELSPYRLAPGDYPWLESNLGTAPEICPPWASGTGGIGAGAGLWIRIPTESGILRWVQQCPWLSP